MKIWKMPSCRFALGQATGTELNRWVQQLWIAVNWRRLNRRLNRTGRSLICLLLGFLFAFSSQIPGAIAQDVARRREAPLATSELRGVWLTNIDSNVLFSKDNIRDAVQRLERLHFNTLYPTVWNGGYTLYPSKVAKDAYGVEVDPNPSFADRDMLKEAIAQGHRKNMSVIPWFEYGLMTNADSALARRHPEWLTKKRDGSTVTRMHDENLAWLNPAHPEVQDFLVNLIREVAVEYDIDGIQLDDHFGMPVTMGYDDYTVALYKQEHRGRRPPDNEKDRAWMRWRARKVSDLMSKVYVAVRSRKPNAIISLSPNPREFSYDMFLQDWFSWARLGLIDELIVQVYRNSQERFLYELNALQSPELIRVRQRIPVSIGILTGLRVMNVDISQVEQQVKTARDRQFAGVAFFFYESLGNRDPAFQSLFPVRAIRPGRRTGAARSS
jgi:uncharacterized lipoprotein YddW (UPF0748 family)